LEAKEQRHILSLSKNKALKFIFVGLTIISPTLMTRYSLLLAFIGLLNVMSISAQSYMYPEDLNKKCLKKFEEGQQFLRAKKYDKAIKAYDQVLKKNPTLLAARIQKARLQYDLGNKEVAKDIFAKTVGVYPEYNVKASKAYASLLLELEEYEEAQRMLKFLADKEPENSELEERYSQTTRINKAMQNAIELDVSPLSDLVNTTDLEYEVSLPLDESKMIFTRRFNNQEDFFEATIEEGIIVKVKPIEELNTPLNEGAHTISSDGHTLIFTFCDNRRTIGGCDLYSSTYINDKWSRPKNLGAQLNSEYDERQPSLSGDGNTLYFQSNRKGGKGGYDIWFSTLRTDGIWQKPLNMGEVINSSANEETPFIHKDGLSLYFSSDSNDGLGKFDIYKASRNAWGTKWQSVNHLPYPINTTYDDRGLKVGRDGVTAYLATDRRAGKKLDIYTFELPNEYRAKKANSINLIVKDKETKQALQAKLILSSQLDTANHIATTADADGNATIPYFTGESFFVHVTHDGYLFQSEAIDIGDGDLTYEIYLQPLDNESLPKDEPIVLKNIFFETGSATLENRSETEIRYLYNLLIEKPEMKIRFVGHTDNVGSDVDNDRLSTERAKAVYDELILKGISANRLQYEGKGERAPIATNDTARGREQNRRTEFYIL